MYHLFKDRKVAQKVIKKKEKRRAVKKAKNANAKSQIKAVKKVKKVAVKTEKEEIMKKNKELNKLYRKVSTTLQEAHPTKSHYACTHK